MDINTNTESFNLPSYLDLNDRLQVKKSKTSAGVDIIHLGNTFDTLYNELPGKNFNIIDFQAISEFDMAHYARFAIGLLPKKENIVICYPTEALNSTYWNVVFDIAQTAGYKNVLWIDGGLTKGTIFRHLHHLKITHFFAPTFFKTLFRPMIVDNMPKAGEIGKRTKHYVSLGRLVRQERIYFTKKLLDNPNLFDKGIVTCGWGDSTSNVWTNEFHKSNLRLMLDDNDISKFPLSLGHSDWEQHSFTDEFKRAIFNVVQESSIGSDPRSHNDMYKPLPAAWQTVSSDRIFFTEKTAKAFLMNQIPILIAAPGMVQVLRNLKFDMFDDIVDHSYDKEDNIFKRCDKVYDELNRLVNLNTISGWSQILQERKFSERFFNNFENVKRLASSELISNWIQENF
jgi:hypothetical protein